MGILWDKKTLYYLSMLGELSILFIVNILIFVYLYRWLFSKYVGENGVWFIFFVLCGIITGGVSVYKLLQKK